MFYKKIVKNLTECYKCRYTDGNQPILPVAAQLVGFNNGSG